MHLRTKFVGERGNQVRVLSDPVTVIREESPVGSIVPQGMRRRVDCWSVSQETCLYVVRLKLPSKVLHPVCKKRCQLSVGEKDIFLCVYKNANLWNGRNRSVVFRDLDYLNLCTIKRQDEQNPVSVDLLYHLPPQPSDIDSSWILCRSRMVSSG